MITINENIAMTDKQNENLKERLSDKWLSKSKTSLEKHLKKAIHDYLQWMITNGYADCTVVEYERLLKSFLLFVIPQKIDWHYIFTWETLTAFKKYKNRKYDFDAVTGFSWYLFKQKKLLFPISKPEMD